MKKKNRNIYLFIESSHGFGRDILRGIARYLEENRNWSVQFEGRGLYEGNLESLEARHWDGLIVRSFNQKIHQQFANLKVPFVELFFGTDTSKPEITNDESDTCHQVVNHFYELGLRHVAFYSYGNSWWIKERARCFADAAREMGLPYSNFSEAPDQAPIAAPTTIFPKESIRLRDWLTGLKKPVGLFAGTDPMALRIINTCHDANIRIPEDIAVCGCDNDALFCTLTTPSLTSVDHNGLKVGWEAAWLLDKKMNREQIPPVPLLIPPRGIIERGSTDFTPADDPDAAEIIRFIRDNATIGIQVNDVLRKFDLSSRTLQRMIQHHLGRTAEQEIIRIRFLKAKQMLEETILSVEQISEISGFASAEYFVKAFKHQFGLTPLQYRRDNINKITLQEHIG